MSTDLFFTLLNYLLLELSNIFPENLKIYKLSFYIRHQSCYASCLHFEKFQSHLCSSVSQYILSFYKFNRGKIYDQMPFLMAASIMMGSSIFIKAPSLGDCQPRLKSDSPAHEMEIASCQAPNRYFKVSGVIKTEILFNSLVIKIQILSLDRLNPLNANY